MLLKTIAGFVNLLVIMGLALFLPAMSFRYPLAWIYLLLFFGASAAITVYLFFFDKNLLQKRLGAPTSEPRAVQKIIQIIAGLVFISIYVVAAFDFRCRWSSVPLWLSYFSDAMLVLSFAILFWVFRENTFLSMTIEVQKNQRVISTGLYAVVRHPMYSAASVLMLFTPLALGSYWALILSVCLVVVIYFRAIDEEKVLKESLTGYEDYCKKVKYRIIPFVL
jgi:protein-S-isoprenylcysteine O-methyltransferase Ste14